MLIKIQLTLKIIGKIKMIEKIRVFKYVFS